MRMGGLEIGDMRVDAINGGAVWMDGGGIFGVVPKVLWRDILTPDDENRVNLWFYSLLVRTDDFTAVIEAGSAAHQPPKVAGYFKAGESRLIATLASLGVEADAVDFFLPTHLHFDHAGAASDPATGPVFPNAEYVLQKAEWETANAPEGLLRNAYLPGDIEGLKAARLAVVDGDEEIAPGLKVVKTGGHSTGHQVVEVGRGGAERLVFAGDIIPMSEHIRPRWLCAFDLFPLDVYAAKVAILERAEREGSMVAAGHAGAAPIFKVGRDARGRFTAEGVAGISPPR